METMSDGYECFILQNGVVIKYTANYEPEDGYGIIYTAIGESGKVYVGQTHKSLLYRAKEHSRNAFRKSNTGYNSKFYKSIRKHNGNFTWSVLKKHIPIEELNDEEMRVIEELETYKYGYNSTIGGEGTRGCPISDAHKNILSKAAKERTIGDKNPMFGKKHSEETKAKISKVHKGKKLSKEQIDTIRAAHIGKKIDQDIREKMSKSRGGRLFLVYKDDIEIGRFVNQRHCAAELKISRSTLQECLRSGKEHDGYRFVYTES